MALSDKTQKIECSGVFIAIGHQPNTLLFKDFLQMDYSKCCSIDVVHSCKIELEFCKQIFILLMLFM